MSVVNVGHLPGQESDGVLAVPVKIGESLGVLPLVCVLFEQSLDVLNFIFGQHSDISLAIIIIKINYYKLL